MRPWRGALVTTGFVGIASTVALIGVAPTLSQTTAPPPAVTGARRTTVPPPTTHPPFPDQPPATVPQPVTPAPGGTAYPPVTLPPLDPGATVSVAATCPGQAEVGQLSSAQWEQLIATQDALLPTLGAVQTYAKPQLGPSQGTRAIAEDLANPSSVFGTIGMGGPANRRVVYIEVSGTDADRRTVAAELTKVVPRPDRVVVCPTAVSEARRAQIISVLTDRFRWLAPNRDERFYGFESWGATGGRVPVHLRSDAVDLARQLQQEYGDELSIWLGHTSWPDRRNPGPGTTASLTARCGTVPLVSGRSRPPFTWSVPRSITVRSGAAFAVRASVRKTTADMVPFTAFRVVVTTLTGRTVVATRASQAAYAAVQDYLEQPTTPVGATGGTDACDTSAGWALAPGRYRVFLVSVWPGYNQYTSPAIALTVKR